MAELFCRNCGQPLRDTDNFCPNCGTRVAREEAEAPSASVWADEEPPSPQESHYAAPEEKAAQSVQTDAPEDAEKLSGEEEIQKNREAFHIDDFDWGNSDYPSDHPHKTEDIDFNWHTAPEPSAPRAERPSISAQGAQTKPEAPASEGAAAEAGSQPEDNTEGIAESVKAAASEEFDWSDEPAVTETHEENGVPSRIERDLDAIDTFYTYSQKNEEFQQILNKEYDRIRQETPAGASRREEEILAEQSPEEEDASPEETLHKLEELAKKAQSVTEASSRAVEAANDLYGIDGQNGNGGAAAAAGESPDPAGAVQSAEGAGAVDIENSDSSDGIDNIKKTENSDKSSNAENSGDAETAGPENAGGAAALPASGAAAMDYVFDPEEEKKKHKARKRKRHIGLKIFITIVVILIIVEAAFLILRKVAPDSMVSVQLERFFMRIADFVYNHMG